MTEDLSPAEKLAQLNEKLRGPALLQLLGVKGKPAPDALVKRVMDLRAVVQQLCAHLPPDDPARAVAIERLKAVERLVEDPLEWHVLLRAQELGKDPADASVRTIIEMGFFEEHVPKTVWLAAPPDALHSDVRKSLRLPVLAEVDLDTTVQQTGPNAPPPVAMTPMPGSMVRLRTENLSRNGVGLCDVPETYAPKTPTVKLILHLSSTGKALKVEGRIVWRHSGGRMGVAFELNTADQAIIDEALQYHFAQLRTVVERWRTIAPKSTAAQACEALVGYYASVLPSNRKPFFDKLLAAADADTKATELQLALAKLRLEENDLDGVHLCLRRAESFAKNDARFLAMRDAYDQRRGPTGVSIGARLRRASAGARAATGAFAGALVVVAAVTAFIQLRGPYESVSTTAVGLPCQSMKLLGGNALCFVDIATYKSIPEAARLGLARQTLDAYRGKGASMVSVYGNSDGVLLDAFPFL